MGLSNEERYEKIVHSIAHIDELSEDLTDRYPYDMGKLKTLCERLWYEFLKKEADGLFWIMGSDLSSEDMKASSLNQVAFCCHKPDRGQTMEDLINERRKEDSYFDHYKILSAFFDMDRLLQKPQRAVLLINAHIQHISYALCRYRDEFMDQYEDLNFVMRQMQGECFKIMKKDNAYAHAWMLHNLCDKIYTMEEKDVVNQWWTKQCNSHDISIKGTEYDEVYKAFKKYQYKKLSVQDRIDLTLLLMGPKYGEYEHQHKEFLKMVEDYNKKHKKNKINVQGIEDAFKKAAEAVKKKKDEPYQRSCEFTDNYVDRDGKVQNLWEH